jgi:hypothetical protein
MTERAELEISTTTGQVRAWLDGHADGDELTEQLEDALDGAQGAVFAGGAEEAVVTIRVGGTP